MRRALAFALALGTVPTAFADEAPAAPVTPPYVITVRVGIDKLAANDPAAAAEALYEAIAIDANAPEAHYYLGIALRTQGDVPRALEELSSAATLAARIEGHRMHGRALLAIAMTLERIPARLGEAREAWLAVAQFAQIHPAIVTAEQARACVQAIDRVLEMERVYAPVRERIAAREAERAQEAAHGPRRRAAH